MPLSELLLGITSPPGLSPGLTQRYGDAQFMPGEKLRGCPTTSLLSIAAPIAHHTVFAGLHQSKELLHVATTVR